MRAAVAGQENYQVRIVKDRLSTQLVMKRECPQFLVVPVPLDEEEFEFVDQLTNRYARDHSLSTIYVSVEPENEFQLQQGYTVDELWKLLDSKLPSEELACSS